MYLIILLFPYLQVNGTEIEYEFEEITLERVRKIQQSKTSILHLTFCTLMIILWNHTAVCYTLEVSNRTQNKIINEMLAVEGTETNRPNHQNIPYVNCIAKIWRNEWERNIQWASMALFLIVCITNILLCIFRYNTKYFHLHSINAIS